MNTVEFYELLGRLQMDIINIDEKNVIEILRDDAEEYGGYIYSLMFCVNVENYKDMDDLTFLKAVLKEYNDSMDYNISYNLYTESENVNGTIENLACASRTLVNVAKEMLVIKNKIKSLEKEKEL